MAAGGTQNLTMSCPASAALVLGGYLVLGPDTQNTEVPANMPNGTVDTWLVKVANHGAAVSQVVLHIRCFTLAAAP